MREERGKEDELTHRPPLEALRPEQYWFITVSVKEPYVSEVDDERLPFLMPAKEKDEQGHVKAPNDDKCSPSDDSQDLQDPLVSSIPCC